jgi:hypothetical protein
MGDALKKVRSGESLRMPAAAYNSFIDAAVELRQRQQSQGREAQREFRQSGLVLVRNDSGADVDQFHVLGIDGPLIAPDASEQNFKDRVALKGVAPTEDDHLGRFVVCIEPIKAGALGVACAAGVCQVKIDVPDEDTERPFAEVADGVTANLEAVHSGSADILWRAGGTGVQWAIVRLGKRVLRHPFPVDLAQSGGSQGDETTPATWTYDVTEPETGDSLATGVDPVASPHKWQRPGVGQMIPATFGYAHYDKDDQLVLGWINEMVDQEACQEETGY